VLTVETRLKPANQTYTHQIVIANGRARNMSELDRWRLVDLNRNTVTFVDGIAKSFRTTPIANLVTKRRQADAGRIPDHAPRVEIAQTSETRAIQGATARKWSVVAGNYKRELWVAEHPSIPVNLFAVLHVAGDVTSPFAPMMKSVDDAIIAMRGFPLADHAELPYGKQTMTVDREIVKIEQKDVPESWLNVPRNYKEVTEPAAGLPSASSRPPNQRTPATGSQPSSTSRKTP
jgi:hypothetical protein